MKRSASLLRACYWFGAIFDAAMVIPMLVPSVGARVLGIDDFRPGVEYRYAMFIGASLMLGWTALLVWADRRPIERRGVLLLTVFPVVLGLAAASVYAVSAGLTTAGRMIPIWIGQAAIAVSFTYAYLSAWGAEQQQPLSPVQRAAAA
jgi:hypothetical protein